MDAEETLARWLAESRRVMAFCGAGVSAESGIPTFRGAGGLWEGHRIEDVATPEAFERDPALVWRFYAARQVALQIALPNAAHQVLAAMETFYAGFLLVTQNVDDLHERAGSRRMIKLHGSLMETRCTGCGAVRPLAGPVEPAAVDAGRLPPCVCGALLRPNVVWFGEMLDPLHFFRMEEFFQRCPPPLGGEERALLLVIGTSGAVSGGYQVNALAHRYGARSVEINPHRTALSEEADLVVRAPAAELLARLWNRIGPGEERRG